jgi:hypothetical protein
MQNINGQIHNADCRDAMSQGGDQKIREHLTDGDLAAVHVDQELLHMTAGHTVQVDNVMLLPVQALGQKASKQN